MIDLELDAAEAELAAVVVAAGVDTEAGVVVGVTVVDGVVAFGSAVAGSAVAGLVVDEVLGPLTCAAVNDPPVELPLLELVEAAVSTRSWLAP